MGGWKDVEDGAEQENDIEPEGSVNVRGTSGFGCRCIDEKEAGKGTFMGEVEVTNSEGTENEKLESRFGPEESNLIIPKPPHSESVVVLLLISTAAGWTGCSTMVGLDMAVKFVAIRSGWP